MSLFGKFDHDASGSIEVGEFNSLWVQLGGTALVSAGRAAVAAAPSPGPALLAAASTFGPTSSGPGAAVISALSVEQPGGRGASFAETYSQFTSQPPPASPRVEAVGAAPADLDRAGSSPSALVHDSSLTVVQQVPPPGPLPATNLSVVRTESAQRAAAAVSGDWMARNCSL